MNKGNPNIMQGDPYHPSEYEILTKEPEAMNVGKLNNIVRELRELLYQQRIKTQKFETKLLAINEIIND